MRKLRSIFALSLALLVVCASISTAGAAEATGQGNYSYTKPDVSISGWNTTTPGYWGPYNTDEKKIEISQGDFSLNYDISYSEDGSILYIRQKVNAEGCDYQLDLSMTNLPAMIENKNFEANGHLNFQYPAAGVWKDFDISWKQP